MLDDSELRRVIESIFHKYYPGAGWDRFSIEFEEDNEGDPSIFIVTDFKPVASGSELAFLDSIHDIRNELRKQGETRLPYVRYRSSEERQRADL